MDPVKDTVMYPVYFVPCPFLLFILSEKKLTVNLNGLSSPESVIAFVQICHLVFTVHLQGFILYGVPKGISFIAD